MVSDLRDGPWTISILLGIGGVCLMCLGGQLMLWYCDYRHRQDMELTHQAFTAVAGLSDVGSRCMETLAGVVPGAIVQARQQKVAVVPRVVRDSLRMQRWTSP